MLTRNIDAALEAMTACRLRLPLLRDLYQPGSPEQAALDEVLTSLRRADETLFRRLADPPTPGGWSPSK